MEYYTHYTYTVRKGVFPDAVVATMTCSFCSQGSSASSQPRRFAGAAPRWPRLSFASMAVTHASICTNCVAVFAQTMAIPLKWPWRARVGANCPQDATENGEGPVRAPIGGSNRDTPAVTIVAGIASEIRSVRGRGEGETEANKFGTRTHRAGDSIRAGTAFERHET